MTLSCHFFSESHKSEGNDRMMATSLSTKVNDLEKLNTERLKFMANWRSISFVGCLYKQI